jgi:hypothetical protein
MMLKIVGRVSLGIASVFLVAGVMFALEARDADAVAFSESIGPGKNTFTEVSPKTLLLYWFGIVFFFAMVGGLALAKHKRRNRPLQQLN